jgi:2-oxoglutarate ferredoxin oxidoreductase subunit gamma
MNYRPLRLCATHPERDVVLAGFGGQGILLAGRLLGNVVVRNGLNVLVQNFYQGFVRGGISECTIVISVDEIDAPASKPEVVAVLDQRAAQSWTDKVCRGGLLMRNSSVIDAPVSRDDVNVVDIPVTDLANEVGSIMCASMVALGALAPLTGAYAVEDCLQALRDVLPPHRQNLIEMNRAALVRGAAFAREHYTGEPVDVPS